MWVQVPEELRIPESCTNAPRNQKEARDIQSGPLWYLCYSSAPWVLPGQSATVSARTKLLKAGSLLKKGFGGNQTGIRGAVDEEHVNCWVYNKTDLGGVTCRETNYL